MSSIHCVFCNLRGPAPDESFCSFEPVLDRNGLLVDMKVYCEECDCRVYLWEHETPD
jgi:hypothetical protein